MKQIEKEAVKYMKPDKANELREKEMRAAFREGAEQILVSPDRFYKDGRNLKIGFESEVAIHRKDLMNEHIEDTRDAIIQETSQIADVELGAMQIEIRTPPVIISNSGGWESIASMYRSNVASVLQATHKHDCSMLRIGSNPFVPLGNIERTRRPKYQIVPDFYNQHRRSTSNTLIGLGRTRIDIQDAAIVSLFQSFQINLEAASFEDAVGKMNRSFMIAPYLLAFSANARYLQCRDTGMQDLRMIAWEKSHDTGVCDLRLLAWEKAFDTRNMEEIRQGRALRVGLPERYFTNLEEYLNRAGSFPFILYDPSKAFQIAIGMTWLDARVKFIDDSLVVELRLLSTQPTIEEELLLTLLYIGRLYDSQGRKETLLPIEFVRENRLSAMLYGMHRSMWFMSDDGAPERLSYKKGMKREIKRAKDGLERVGLLKYFKEDFLQELLRSGSPSDRLFAQLRTKQRGISHENMKGALRAARMLV